MPDRADYLARILIARMRSLDEVLADRAEADPGSAAQRRIELIEKVLATEAGVLDGATHRLVLAALPSTGPGRPVTDRDLREFATFMRRQLPVDA